jgi:hypothetical protein
VRGSTPRPRDDRDDNALCAPQPERPPPRVRPTEAPQELITEKTFIEENLWAYLQLMYRLPRTFSFGARDEIRGYLNQAQHSCNTVPTPSRCYDPTPSPEHWFEIAVEGRY